jgi:hypothetical protein
MKYKLGDILEIDFYDHQSLSPTWHDLNYVSKEPIPVGTAWGMLIYEDELTYRLTTMIIKEKNKLPKEMGSCHTIIKGAVKSIKILEKSAFSSK